MTDEALEKYWRIFREWAEGEAEGYGARELLKAYDAIRRQVAELEAELAQARAECERRQRYVERLRAWVATEDDWAEIRDSLDDMLRDWRQRRKAGYEPAV